MARDFIPGSTQSMDVDSTPVTAAPFTIAAWIQSDHNFESTIFFVGDKDVAAHYWFLSLVDAGAGEDLLSFGAAAGGAEVTAEVTASFTDDGWHHVCGVETSATSRAAYLDGANKGTNATSREPAGADRISIGRKGDSTPTAYMDGFIAEVAVWNVALSDADVALLAKTTSPFLVVPQSLVFYAPLIGRYSPEIDIRGGANLTLSASAPAVAAHPRIYNMSRPLLSKIVSPVAAGGIPFRTLMGVGT